MSILVVGTVALDSIETPCGRRSDCLGGSATFFSLSASYFSHVNLVAVVGEDFPRRHYLFLKKRKNIDTTGLEIKKGKTFRWKATYVCDINNPRTLDTQLNVFAQFKPVIPKDYRKSRYLFLANIDPDLQYSILPQLPKPRIIACDSMNYWIKTKRPSLVRLLKNVDIFFANDTEARMLAEDDNILKAARHITGLGAKIAIIKKGEHGVLFYSKKSSFVAPAYLLENVIDPTGAGDTFAGGFMGYLSSQSALNDRVFRNAIVYGAIMASFKVESFSVDKLAALRRVDIEKRYREFVRLTSFCKKGPVLHS
jgi:sugar/nucleoside kinase (ribokinase family)